MKKILAIILIVFTLCCLTACESYEAGTKRAVERKIENLGFVVVEHIFAQGEECACIAYDPDTKVKYIIYDGYRSFSICPYYDETGNVTIYEGD